MCDAVRDFTSWQFVFMWIERSMAMEFWILYSIILYDSSQLAYGYPTKITHQLNKHY